MVQNNFQLDPFGIENIQALDAFYFARAFCAKSTRVLARSELSFSIYTGKNQAPVVQRLDNTIYWINCYPADKC